MSSRWARRRAWLSVFGFLCACTSSAGKPPATPQDPLHAFWDEADEPRVRALAPDFLARARRARDQAEATSDPESAADHGRRAKLLFEAALAEAERIELERQSARLGAQVTEAARARAADERLRLELQAEFARIQAAIEAQREASAAFAVLGREAASALRQAGRDPSLLRAHAFLLDRARASLAAARALGAHLGACEEAEQAIAAAELVSPAAAASAVQRAFSRAQRALGDARARQPDPTADHVEDLLARVRELGLRAVLSPTGVLIALEDDDVRALAPPRPSSVPARLRLLGHVLLAYPHGPIEIVAMAQGNSPRPGEKLAERAHALLSEVHEPSRIALRVAPTPGGLALGILLPAYAGESAHTSGGAP